MVRRILLTILVLLFVSFASGAFAPICGQIQNQSARKIDEFGDVYPTDAAARLDFFAIEIQNNPDTHAFIIVYRSHRDLPGISGRHARWMRTYLVYSRGIKAERISAIDGGEASSLSHELWIVPVGTAPTPRADAYPRGIIDTESARKFDEYYWDAPHDLPESFSIEYADTLEGFANALSKEPRALAYIIGYAGYHIEHSEDVDKKGRTKRYRQVWRDPPGTVLRKLRIKKADLVKTFGIASSRIKLVDGGYRKRRALELWIVPPGEHAPIPTPNAFPPQRPRRRK